MTVKFIPPTLFKSISSLTKDEKQKWISTCEHLVTKVDDEAYQQTLSQLISELKNAGV